jgi:GTP cyclohydrolase I
MQSMPDVQSSRDERNLPIQRVGIKSIRYPITFENQATIASFNMYVHLPADQKGTHMSRFVELLEAQKNALFVSDFEQWVKAMCVRLDAQSGCIEMSFPYFVHKKAPISGVESLLDYDMTLIGEVSEDQSFRLTLKMIIPVTSLCPCSKKISSYGAHNQRSHITLTLLLSSAHIDILNLISSVESQASCQLYGLLKRPDEKFVTEYAYDHPKFVEDLVRDVAFVVSQCDAVSSYTVESENFESIHNHSAYALIRG